MFKKPLRFVSIIMPKTLTNSASNPNPSGPKLSPEDLPPYSQWSSGH